MYVCMYVYVCPSVSMRVSLCACMHACICGVCLYIPIYQIHQYVYIYMTIYKYVYMSMYLYIYTHVPFRFYCTYIEIYTYTRASVAAQRNPSSPGCCRAALP